MESVRTSSWLGHGCSVGAGLAHGCSGINVILAEVNGRHDVFGKPTPRSTVNTEAFGASTPVPLLLPPPPENPARRSRLRSPRNPVNTEPVCARRA